MGGGNLELLLVTIIWGFNSIAVKDAVGVFLPLQFNVIRLSLAGSLLVALMAFTGKMEYPARKDWPIVILSGFFGNTLYQYAFIKGIAMSSASNTSFVLATMPATTAVLSHLFGKQKMTRRMVAGVLLTVVGVSLVAVAGSGSISFTSETARGDLITLAGTLGWCVSTIFAADLVKRMSPTAYTAWTMVAGAALMVPLAIGELKLADWGAPSALNWAELVFSASFALVFSYILWNKGVKESGPASTAIFGNLTPVWTGVFGWLILKEGWTPVKFAGAAIILAGVSMVRFGKDVEKGQAADSRRREAAV
ncbi:MAG: DMT family transporter [Bacillota bacterium]